MRFFFFLVFSQLLVQVCFAYSTVTAEHRGAASQHASVLTLTFGVRCHESLEGVELPSGLQTSSFGKPGPLSCRVWDDVPMDFWFG